MQLWLSVSSAMPQTCNVYVTALPEGTKNHKAEHKQHMIQARRRPTSLVKQKVIKHPKGNEHWPVWDQKAEAEAHHANAVLNSASQLLQLLAFKINIIIIISWSFISELEARNKFPKSLKPRKVWKWNRLPFLVPFQEVVPPCSSTAAFFKIHRDLRRNHSRLAKRKIRRRRRWGWTWVPREERKGGALALMLQPLVGAMVPAETCLRTRAELQGCGAARTLPASTAALPPGSPRRPPARGLRARLPTPRWLYGLRAAHSRTRVASTEN